MTAHGRMFGLSWGAQAQTRSNILKLGTGLEAQRQFLENVKAANDSPVNIQGYNNKIVIAGTDATVGHNPGISELAPISTAGDKTLEGKIVPPVGTVHRGPGSTQQPKQPAVAKPRPQPVAKPQQHEEEKAPLVVGGIGVGLVTLSRITS